MQQLNILDEDKVIINKDSSINLFMEALFIKQVSEINQVLILYKRLWRKLIKKHLIIIEKC